MTQQLSWIHHSPSTDRIVWKLYIDGAARGNPGPAGVGIYITRDTTVIVREGFFIGSCTNNQAEYTALLLGLCRLRMLVTPADDVHIFSDSELLVRQIKNIYRVQNVILKRLHTRAHELLQGIAYQTHHIPRAQNKIADALANDGIDNTRYIPEDLQTACGVNYEGLPCS
jgi:ribonuclease HI